MSSKRTWTAALAAVTLAFAGASAADAAQLVATFKGKVTTGFDGGGKVFGVSDLAGQDYEITYLIDETIYTSRSAAPGAPVGLDQPHYQIVAGYGADTPILEVTLTINGVSESIDYADYAPAYADGKLEWINSPGAPRGFLDVRGNLGRPVTYGGGFPGYDYVNFVNQATSSALIPYTLSDGWNASPLQHSPIPVYFARSWGDSRGGYDFFYQITSGTVTSATLEAYVPPGNGGGNNGGNPGVVPEPTTWAMMILGFGAAGSVIRRRRAIAA